MKVCYLKETKTYAKWRMFFFLYLGIKKGLDAFWINEGSLHIFKIPIFKNKKNYQKIMTYLKRKGMKKVCADLIQNEYLLQKIKENFEIIQGNTAFSYFFEEIIDKFMKMHSFLYEESELIFISNAPARVKEYLEKVVKKFKKVSVYTSQKQKFNHLTEETLKMYGTTLFLKDAQEKPKKYKKIYVNLENKKIFHKKFFKNVTIIDIFKTYENAFCEVLFKIPFEKDNILKEEKINKNLCFLEYLTEKSKINLQKECKVVNIRKI